MTFPMDDQGRKTPVSDMSRIYNDNLQKLQSKTPVCGCTIPTPRDYMIPYSVENN
jgi:hypothetical protein